MLLVNDLLLEFGQRVLFDKLSFSMQSNQKIGLVGANGAGKSTLLKVLSGELKPDAGTISCESGKKLGYLPQEVTLTSQLVVIDEVMTVWAGEVSLLKEQAALEAKFADGSAEDDDFERYVEVCEAVLGASVDEKRIEGLAILKGLGFSDERIQTRVDELSLGWRMRVVLAKLLLQKADFYLLDEPTNHLDIVAKDWFIQFLARSSFGFLLVSHDRFFLDNVCKTIYALERGKGTFYAGNYSFYLEESAAAKERLESQYAEQQREIKHKMELVYKFRAKASKASFAQSLLKGIERMEKIELPPDQSNINIKLGKVMRSGRVVLTIEGVKKSFGDKHIFENASFEVIRDDKLALVAANGVGKSTLLHTIVDRLNRDAGSIEFGHQVTWAFFEQDQGLVLDPRKTILETVEEACVTSEARGRCRALLGSFLFSGDSVNKKVGVLSGGEKNRVAMVKVLLQGANFLVLDEPTNHLDIISKEILLEALKAYEGTVLFVSHDRDFLDRLANKIIELEPLGTTSYEGNYEAFLYAKEQKMQKAASVKPADKQAAVKEVSNDAEKPGDSKQSYEISKQLQRLERSIAKHEEELAQCHKEYAEHTYGTCAYNEVAKRAKEAQQQLDEAWLAWETLEHERLSMLNIPKK
ncbi:ABC-F family ATP-binding cassette domain-containing protein [Candidatus Dependentiae bacterium]|nr:ABC-F family ATP-binding cassette domain-containing protein [Candidatus Dependentiae bacterium]